MGHCIDKCNPFKARVQELIDQKMLSFTLVIAEAPVEKRFEYKGPLIRVQVHPPVVQHVMQYSNQGYHPGMLLAYPGESSSTVVAPQYACTRAPYNPFGIHYGQTSHQIVNPGLVHSAQMFQPQSQISLMSIPCYSFPHGVTSQYQ